MCGRYFLDLEFEEILKYYDFIEKHERFDYRTGEIFPTNPVAVITPTRFTVMRWGMKYDFMKRDLINGRSETIGEKRLFREAFQKRRVIIPATAYFEWETVAAVKYKRRISVGDRRLLSMAGICNRIRMGEDVIDSVVILTREAQSDIAHIHERMPVIVPPEMELDWLTTEDPARLLAALERIDTAELTVE